MVASAGPQVTGRVLSQQTVVVPAATIMGQLLVTLLPAGWAPARCSPGQGRVTAAKGLMYASHPCGCIFPCAHTCVCCLKHGMNHHVPWWHAKAVFPGERAATMGCMYDTVHRVSSKGHAGV